jgi:transposase
MRKPQQGKPLNDLSQSLTTLDANCTLIAVIEMAQKSWLVAGIVPGVERQPLKKLDTDESAFLKLLDRWRMEAERAGHKINRITVAFEAGRDGFWLARWLRARGIEAHVIQCIQRCGVAGAPARKDRPARDTELLKRAFLGWLRGERDHCKWSRSPPSRMKMPNGPTASATASLASKLASSIA